MISRIIPALVIALLFPTAAWAIGTSPADQPLCLWYDAFIFTMFIGSIVTTVIYDAMRWLSGVPVTKGPAPLKPFTFNCILYSSERIAVALITLGSLQAAFAFAVALTGFKLAANWNRANKLETIEWPTGMNEGEKWQALSRGTLSSLVGSLVALGFGIGGGLIIKGDLKMSLTLCSLWPQ